MKIRNEIVITIDRSWATPENEDEEIDVVLPKDATDFMVYEYDSQEILFIVENGKIKTYNNYLHKFEECGGNTRVMNGKELG